MTQKSKDNLRFGVYLVLAVMTAVGTVMACGVMVGRTEQRQDSQEEKIKSLGVLVEIQESRTDDLAIKQSFLEGQLTARLESLEKGQDRIITFIENLELDNGKN